MCSIHRTEFTNFTSKKVKKNSVYFQAKYPTHASAAFQWINCFPNTRTPARIVSHATRASYKNELLYFLDVSAEKSLLCLLYCPAKKRSVKRDTNRFASNSFVFADVFLASAMS
jgi:hypothetical protein